LGLGRASLSAPRAGIQGDRLLAAGSGWAIVAGVSANGPVCASLKGAADLGIFANAPAAAGEAAILAEEPRLGGD
jgi:hypothetical protein